MTFCAVTNELNKYLDQQDRDSAYEVLVETKLEEIIDALSEWDLKDYEGCTFDELRNVFQDQAEDAVQADLEFYSEPDEDPRGEF